MAGILAAAENTLSMGNASIQALQIFDALSRQSQPNAKAALLAVRTIVLALWEGYAGRVRGKVIVDALAGLSADLQKTDGMPNDEMLAKFRGAL